MELPVMDKFCFVFHLRTGCLIMGGLNLLLSFLLAASMINFAYFAKGDSEGTGVLKKMEGSDENISSVLYTIVVMLSILLFVKIFSEVIFVYATYKERISLMKKYCIFWIVFAVLFVIGFLKTLFHMNAGYVIAQTLYLAENFYFIIIIRSYLISINENGVL